MGLLRGIDGSAPGAAERGARLAPGYEERRRAVRSGRLGEATLACPSCDAPVAIGSLSLSASDPLTCPFCAHHAPVREFLSLASPTRPARVVIRVVRRTGTAA